MPPAADLLIDNYERTILVFQMPVLYKFENIKVFVDIFWQRMRPIGTMNDSNSQFIVVMLGRYHKIQRGVAFMHSLVRGGRVGLGQTPVEAGRAAGTDLPSRGNLPARSHTCCELVGG